nr:pleckstrin homology domain-containing family J member 1 isoform X2 [Zootoca vivipara]
MRYNERELLSLSRQPAEKAAEVLMRAPKKGSALKKRLVKLVVNFLFYFRTDEAEPIGALLLEHCSISQEEGKIFSISFLEEPERKYFFECDTEEQCLEWVVVLQRARTANPRSIGCNKINSSSFTVGSVLLLPTATSS